MKKSHILILTVFIGLSLVLSACVPGPRVVGTPGISLSDEMVFVSYSSFVYGLNPETGSVVWHYPEEGNNQVVFYAPPLVAEGFVYVGDLANNFHKLNIETGAAEWTFSNAKGYYIGQAAEENGTVYAPSNDGRLYVISENGDLLWSFKTDHYLWSQPQISESAIFIGSMDHNVYAISKTGQEIWSVEMKGAVVGSPVLSGDEAVLFVGSVGSEMTALDAADGALIWSFETVDSVWGNPILMDDLLYVSDSGGNLYALDTSTGQLDWQTQIVGSVIGGLTAIEDGFVLATEEGVVKAFNYDGSPKWEYTLDGEIFQSPAVNDELLVAGTINGENLIYGFNLAGVQLWSTTPEK